MKKGKLIVICGIDGSGKTTLQQGVANRLESIGLNVLTTRQPSNFYRTNPDIRRYLDSGISSLSVNTIAMLAATDRMLHIEKTILPSLTSGKVVICDRYVYSTYAYFQARSANMDFVKSLNQYVPEPDAGIMLDIDPQLTIKRIVARDGASRKFEETDANYLNIVQGYLKASLPGFFNIISSSQPVELILDKTLRYLESRNVY